MAVTPRFGHLHVTVDNGPFRWIDASNEPIVINGLQPGPYKVRLQLVNANHQPLDEDTITFVVPAGSGPPYHP